MNAQGFVAPKHLVFKGPGLSQCPGGVQPSGKVPSPRQPALWYVGEWSTGGRRSWSWFVLDCILGFHEVSHFASQINSQGSQLLQNRFFLGIPGQFSSQVTLNDSKMLEAHGPCWPSRNLKELLVLESAKKRKRRLYQPTIGEQTLSFPAPKIHSSQVKMRDFAAQLEESLGSEILKFASRMMTGPTTICFFDLYRLKLNIKPKLLVVVFPTHSSETGMAIEPGSFEDNFSIAKEVPGSHSYVSLPEFRYIK